MTGDMGIDDACILSVSVGRWERTKGKIIFFFTEWLRKWKMDMPVDFKERHRWLANTIWKINKTRGSWGYQFTIGFSSESETAPKVDLHFHYQFKCAKLSWAELCLKFVTMVHPTHLQEVISRDRYQPLTTLPLHQTSVWCITWRERHY